MTAFASILVPLDGSRMAARGLGCAAWLAGRLGARLHVLSATPRELPARAELARLRVPEEHWPRIALHQAPTYPEGAILEALARYRVSLIVMSACGESAEGSPEAPAAIPGIVGHVTRAVIEQSPVPVLLLPPAYREAVPWERILAPISGEAETDEALALALRLAHALDLDVHVAHVAGGDGSGEGLAARTRYADALHHEYEGQLEELVRRILPQSGPEECRRIAGVALCRGDIAAELLELTRHKRISLLAVGWHGQFAAGHAGVLKALIRQLTCPIILVKPAPRMPFRLKVGEEIE